MDQQVRRKLELEAAMKSLKRVQRGSDEGSPTARSRRLVEAPEGRSGKAEGKKVTRLRNEVDAGGDDVTRGLLVPKKAHDIDSGTHHKSRIENRDTVF